ncbi:PadR family transcriptional regulator [Halalkalibacterium ligniniphilum]|uniref:PadR family transcriptional regulator n=1 Tax=Halalkalibacterium ligniniphilum TaxID=1134413 RepID=UPI000377CD40|nr:PadR family transcriptional regulator [Halalkalibacterium ligniniphilum]
MSLKACILGLLSLQNMTGYELNKTFESSISYNWSSSRTQIYTALRSLDKNGLVESDLIVQHTKPNKKVYRITSKGRNFLEEWLLSPTDSSFAKDEFLIRVFFANHLDNNKALLILEQNLASMESQVQKLNEIRTEITNQASSDPFQLMTLDLRVAGLNGMITETRRQMKLLQSNSQYLSE